MAQKNLTTSYLALLSVANHDGVTAQIYERLSAYQTQNPLLLTAIQGVGTARSGEDIAFKRYSGKDFASDDLKREDELEDNYMSVIRNLLNALLYLPKDEPLRRDAELAVQLFKDFNFSTKDGFEAEARKTLNMVQEWTGHPEKYNLEALGIRPWVMKANEQASKVIQIVGIRIDNESAKVKGELADARKATDAAIRKAYDIINAMNVLQPSAELSALINVLLSIEERAKQYYISSASGANVRPNGSGGSNGNNEGGETPTPDPGTGGGETPTPDPGGDTPVNPDPGTGGGGNNPEGDDEN